MEKMLRDEKEKIVLHLLRSIPHPGKILLEAIGDGLPGFSLRPRSIPQEITGGSVRLQLLKDGGFFNENSSFEPRLYMNSNEWQQWVSQKPSFIVRAEDVGRKIDVIQQRRKSFNRNLLHEFLDKFPICLTIGKEDKKRILDNDTYPFYFWDRAVSISSTVSSTGRALALKAEILGLKDCQGQKAISIDRLHLNYWQFLLNEQKSLMKAVIRWHKALIAIYHLLRNDHVDLPINVAEMDCICRREIETASKS